jgi:hypothetical protein
MVATLALAVCQVCPVNAAQLEYDDVLGIWTLTKVLDSAEITSMDHKEAAQFVGRTLVVEHDKVSFAGELCGDQRFERHQEPAAKYVRENYHAPVGRLGLPDMVTVIDLRCTEALIKGTNKVVFFWGGFFYDAERRMPSKSGARKR